MFILCDYRPISFLGQEMKSNYPPGVAYHECVVVPSPPRDDRPLLAIAAAEPFNITCALPSSISDNFTELTGANNCYGQS